MEPSYQDASIVVPVVIPVTVHVSATFAVPVLTLMSVTVTSVVVFSVSYLQILESMGLFNQ